MKFICVKNNIAAINQSVPEQIYLCIVHLSQFGLRFPEYSYEKEIALLLLVPNDASKIISIIIRTLQVKQRLVKTVVY